MTLLGVILTALLLSGAIYVGIKLRSDWRTGDRGLITLGIAALIGNLMMLALAGRGLMATAGDGLMIVTGL
jgi:hypothetical protein